MSVSHELRTPLTAIRGHVEALREGLVEDPELRARLARRDRARDATGSSGSSATCSTSRSSTRTGSRCCRRRSTWSGSSTRRTRRSARRRAGARSTTTRRSQAQPVIVTDGDRVLQIITNLLSNAFRWTPGRRTHRARARAANGAVSVAVDDTGPGIAEHERERIFRPFWSRDGAGGTGLGLAIARELASALGGRIDLESEPGRGSRFELVLPAAVERSRSGRDAGPAGGRSSIAVSRDRRASSAGRRSSVLLEPGEPRVDALPAGRDQVDEQREVVDAGVPLGEHVALDPLEPAEHAFDQPAHLGDLPADRAAPRRARLREPPRRPRRAAPTRARPRRPRAPRSASRARSSAASTPAGSGRPSARSASRCLARSIAPSSIGRTLALARRMDTARARLRAPAGADRAAAARAPRRVAAPRLRARDGRRAAPALRRPGRGAGRRARRRQRHARRPGAAPPAAPGGGAAEVLLLERLDGTGSGRGSRGRRGGCAPGGGSARSSSSSTWARVAGALRLEGEPAGETPLPPYITEPLADPERYQTVYARRARARRPRPTAGLHFTPELLARLDVERVTLHVGLDTFRPVTASALEEHALHGERYAVDAGGVGADPRRRARARGRDDDRSRARDARARRPARRPDRALRHARLRVPPRGRAADELPPAALDAARARDGVRGGRGDARASTGSRSRSATASTRSATRCSSCELHVWRGR